VDLGPTEEILFSRIKKKARYNIRQAKKNGVKVEVGSKQHIEKFYTIYKKTSEQKSFPIFPIDYFYYIWSIFSKENKIYILLANKDDSIQSAMILIPFGDRICSLWGSTMRTKPDLKAGYILEWEAMKMAKSLGYAHYDLCGIDPTYVSSSSRFKASFGGTDFQYPNFITERYYGMFPRCKKMLANSLWEIRIIRKIVLKFLFKTREQLPF